MVWAWGCTDSVVDMVEEEEEVADGGEKDPGD